MGLDTSHGCWHGAYSAFSRWRNKLAEVAGYQLTEVQGEYATHTTAALDWGSIPGSALDGDWPAMPTNHRGEPEPLLILLAHSDCEGWIRAKDCGLLADRLEGLLLLLPEEGGGGHIGDWRTKTQQFIDGLRRAAGRGEDVEFH